MFPKETFMQIQAQPVVATPVFSSTFQIRSGWVSWILILLIFYIEMFEEISKSETEKFYPSLIREHTMLKGSQIALTQLLFNKDYWAKKSQS